MKLTHASVSQSTAPHRRLRQGLAERICDLRQLRHPPEFRIRAPAPRRDATSQAHDTAISAPDRGNNDRHQGGSSVEDIQLDESIAKVAVCLWDIQQRLHGNEAVKQDKKLRILTRRAESALFALQDAGVVIDDPIGRAYAAGSEGSMQPTFLPTPGASREDIVETISPIIYRDDRLIKRGEVFVAVPPQTDTVSSERGTDNHELPLSAPVAADMATNSGAEGEVSNLTASEERPDTPAESEPNQNSEASSTRHG